MKGSREAFTFIPCHLASTQTLCLTNPPPPSCLFLYLIYSLSPCLLLVSLSQTHLYVSPSLSFLPFLSLSLTPSLSPPRYDLGVRVAPTPSLHWIRLPCHYSVVPPARVLHVRHSGACLPACCLPLRTCRLGQLNHRRPWSVESLQPWHRLLWKNYADQ